MAKDKYKLVRGDVELGVVTHIEDDQPNHLGRFVALPAFEKVRRLFEEEAELLRTDPSSRRWRTIRDEIDKPGIFLEPYEWVGKRIQNPLIHIRGNDVWWR